MSIKKIDELMPGVFILDLPNFPDERGYFRKIYNEKSFSDLGLSDFRVAETFLSKSSKGVLRGMHYQEGNAAHDKLVCCIGGSMFDVVVDIRPNSINFNKPVSYVLTESNPVGIFIPKGFAHGYLSLTNDCWTLYATSTVHQPTYDKGVLWSSIDLDWPNIDSTFIMSKRDKSHPPIHSLK